MKPTGFLVNFYIQFQESPYPELLVGDASLGHPLYTHKVGLKFLVIGQCSLIFYMLYDAYSVILPYCYITIFQCLFTAINSD